MDANQASKNSNTKVRLSEYLPNGAQTLLAEKHGFTHGYISQILSGIRRNDIVYMDALDMAEKEKVRRQKAKVEEDLKQKEIQDRIAQLSE